MTSFHVAMLFIKFLLLLTFPCWISCMNDSFTSTLATTTISGANTVNVSQAFTSRATTQRLSITVATTDSLDATTEGLSVSKAITTEELSIAEATTDSLDATTRELPTTAAITVVRCTSSPCLNGGTCLAGVTGDGSYTCQCFSGYYGWNCESTVPMAYGTSDPGFGPSQGGTHVTLNITNPADKLPSSVSIGDSYTASCTSTFTSSGTVTTTFTTPMINRADVGQTMRLALHYDSIGVMYNTYFTFTFYDLPIVTGIKPNLLIYSGGIRLTVQGQGLTVAQTTVLNVTVISRQWTGSKLQVNVAGYQSACQPTNYTTSICITPAVVLSNAWTAFMEKIASNVTAVNALINNSYTSDGRNTIHVYAGLMFDGYAKYPNLTAQLGVKGSLVLIPAPTVFFNPQAITLHRGSANYGVSGYYVSSPQKTLFRGCSIDDYKVYLEGRKGTVVSVYRDSLYFLWPSTRNLSIDPTLTNAFTCERGYFHAQVFVGYRMYPLVCLVEISPCSPSPCSNGATCVDLWTNYTCNCPDSFYGKDCSNAYPIIHDVYPLYGPTAGGTPITIVTSLAVHFSYVLAAYFGDKYRLLPTPDSFVDENSRQYLVVLSPPYDDGSSMNASLKVEYVWDEKPYALNRSVPDTFSYLTDPTIDLSAGISPREHLLSGGTTLTVSGTNLDSVAVPRLDIMAMISLGVPGDMSVQATAVFSSQCTTVSNETMVCGFPEVDVPAGFLRHFDQDQGNPETQGIGTVTGPGTYGFNTYELWNGTKCPRYNTGPSMSPGSSIDFLVGFTLDGVVYDPRTTGINVTAFPPPNICFNNTFLVYATRDAVLQIQGEYLLRLVSWTDYKVYIEDVPCDILAVDANHIDFVPSTNATPHKDYFKEWYCPPPYVYHLVVTIVGGYSYNAGCVAYNTSAELNHCLLNANGCLNGGTCIDLMNSGDQTNAGFSCSCRAGFYGDYCQLVVPNLNDLSPTYGPISGGTIVTIKGKLIPNVGITPVGVSFGITQTDNILFSNSTHLVVSIPSWPSDVMKFTGPYRTDVNVTYSDRYSWPVVVGNVKFSFTYLSNPTVLSLRPRDHILSGGTLLLFNGTWLNVSQSPSMKITVQTQSPADNNGYLPPAFNTYFLSDNCSFDKGKGDRLLCVMPETEIPPLFMPLIDGVVDNTAALLTKRRRRGTSVGGGGNSLQYVEDPDTGAKLTVFVTLQFDNYTLNVNDTLLLHNPPQVFLPYVVVPVIVNVSQYFEIRGTGFTIGSNSTTDVWITIGGVLLSRDKDNVRVYANRTQFTVPDWSENMTSVADKIASSDVVEYSCTSSTSPDYGDILYDQVDLQYTYPVEIIFGNAVYQAGCIQYVDSVTTADVQYYLGVAVGGAVGGAILIMLLVVFLTMSSA